jgi:TonB family protein
MFTIASIATALTPVMTNSTVEAMVSGGVSTAMIVRAIKTAARIEFFSNEQEHLQLIKAGASASAAREIMEAIQQREYNGADPSPAPRPVPAVPPSASSPTPTLPAEALAKEARAAGIQGTVVLQFDVGVDGVPHNVLIVRGLHPDVDQSAIDAMNQWRFQPGTNFRQTSPDPLPLLPRPEGKARVFVGNNERFLASNFGSPSVSGSSTENKARVEGLVPKSTLTILKSIGEACPDKVVVVNSPDLADYFIRTDYENMSLEPPKMVAFNRSGEISFMSSTRKIDKDAQDFCSSLR